MTDNPTVESTTDIVSAIRPKIARICEKVVELETNEFRRLLAEILPIAENPTPGTLWAIDGSHCRNGDAVQAAMTFAHPHVQRMLIALEKYATTLLLILRHDQLLLLPAWTVSRAILEIALQICWHTDPEVPSEMRIARAATVQFDVLQGSRKHLRKLPLPKYTSEAAKLAATLKQMIRMYARDGITVRHQKGDSKRDIVAVIWRDNEALLHPKITDLETRFLPFGDQMYSMLSGGAHARPWLMNGLEGEVDDSVKTMVLPLLDVSDALTKALCCYFGLDPVPIIKKREFRRNAVLHPDRTIRPEWA